MVGVIIRMVPHGNLSVKLHAPPSNDCSHESGMFGYHECDYDYMDVSNEETIDIGILYDKTLKFKG